MSHSIQLKNTTSFLRNSLKRSPLRRGCLLIAFALAWFALSPAGRAVSPPPDGGYPNETTAEGENALFSLTSGIDNTAIGFEALFSNTTGSLNTATGDRAMISNTTGGFNTADGYLALSSNTTGNDNTAVGEFALVSNSTASDNTATGSGALSSNTTASDNTANGSTALFFNTTGIENTATGSQALINNTTGNNNSATGFQALGFNKTGSNNIAVGALAGNTLTTGSNNIYIGNAGSSSGESAKIRIGTTGTQKATFIAGINGVTVAGGVGVIVGTDGKLGTVVSSKRFKDEIKPMDKASEAILALQPVTFRYKHELDPDGVPQFGLVAEEVEKVNPDLVARDAQGKVYTVRYEAVNAMLLNEFLKAHRKIESQDKRVQELEATVAQLKSALKEQASLIQQVTRLRRVELSPAAPLSKAAARLVVDNQ